MNFEFLVLSFQLAFYLLPLGLNQFSVVTTKDEYEPLIEIQKRRFCGKTSHLSDDSQD